MRHEDLRFRQVHLDFHTSERIPGVGADFEPDRFADTLIAARVDSVTCFARCHHGWIYFDTQRFPERRHPHLSRNLLAEQIAACHARGLRVPIYTSVMADFHSAVEHPEWCRIGPDARWCGSPVYEPGFWRLLCLNTPYRRFLFDHVAEILETLPVDGLFFDILHPQDCSCRHCIAAMDAAGLDPADAAQRQTFGAGVTADWVREMTAFVRARNADCSLFYNAGHVGPGMRQVLGAFTHFELESLPSGGWGYMHFPSAMRYARTLGRPCVGMTGKFHTAWGDFHSYKNPAALEFECFQMLAQGAACSVGDQLHPRGALDGPTYDLIGRVYRQVEAKEPWCRGARAVAEIAVLTPQPAIPLRNPDLPPEEQAAVRMLQEEHLLFDVIDREADFSRYRLVILPDTIAVGDALAAKLETYLGAGGAVIASHRAGLAPDGRGFAVPSLGVEFVGEAEFSPDFLVPSPALAAALPRAEHVMYLRALHVRPAEGAEVLAETVAPYFDRTWRHFCSHAHTPSGGRAAYPGIVRRGRAIYFAHPIFTQYRRNAPLWCRRLLSAAIRLLLGEPVLTTDGPSAMIATLTGQPREGRHVVHLLHYVPERRGEAFDTIEDVIPLHDVAVSVRLPTTARSVRLVPSGEALAFEADAGCVRFRVPRLVGHAMIELR